MPCSVFAIPLQLAILGNFMKCTVLQGGSILLQYSAKYIFRCSICLCSYFTAAMFCKVYTAVLNVLSFLFFTLVCVCVIASVDLYFCIVLCFM